MSKNTTSILWGVGIAILAVIVLWLVTSLGLWSILIGIVIGFVVGVILIARSRDEEPTSVAREALNTARRVVKPDDDDMEQVTGKLLTLQVSLRTEYAVGAPVLGLAETIIDKLVSLAEALNRRFPGDDLTFETCRIATYHLPRCLTPYLEAGTARKDAEADVLKALRAIDEEVSSIDELIKSESIDAARHRAGAVSARFADFGGS